MSPSFRKHLERVMRQCLSPALSFSAWNHRHGHVTSAAHVTTHGYVTWAGSIPQIQVFDATVPTGILMMDEDKTTRTLLKFSLTVHRFSVLQALPCP